MLDEPLGSIGSERQSPILAALGVAPPAANAFVGRSTELAELCAGLEGAIAGRGSLFLICGEPGIGKTRLASELAREARSRDALVTWGRCWEAGGAPSYWPWVEVIRQVLREPAPPTAADLGRHASYLAQLVPDLPRHLGAAVEAAPQPADPDSARFFMFDAVAALLRCAARQRPLVVIVDDFHAADRVSLLLLTFLARTLADAAVLLVGTYRDREAGATEELVEPLGELARQARRLALGGLAARDVARLIESAAGRPPSEALVAGIHSVTEGNPFFIDEVLRLLASQGRLASGDSAAPFGIPEGVREAVRRRLAPLSMDSAALLELAAVAGRELDTAVLRVAAGLDAMTVAHLLADPVRRGLVHLLPGAGRFSFHHALIREVLYEGLAPARRLRLHREIGEALEALSAGDPDRYVAELAHHFLAAAPSSDGGRFAEHGARAARHAMRRMAFEEAVTIYQRTLDALSHAPADERRRCELLLALGEAKEWASDVQGSRATAEQAAAIARRLGATDLLARAALGVGAIRALKSTATTRWEGAADLLHEALLAISATETATRARLRSRLALHRLMMGSRSEALELSAQAVDDARLSGAGEALAHALIARHAVLFGADHMDERCAIAAEILELAAALGSREFEMRGQALCITNFFDLGDIKAADEAIEAHARLANETADPFERWVSLLWHSARSLLVGRFDEAERLSLQAFELTRSVPGPHAFEDNGPTTYAGQTILIQAARYSGLPDPDVIHHYRERYPEVAAWQVAHLHRLTRLGNVDEVRRELDTLSAQGLVSFERNGTWLAAMSSLSESIALVGNLEQAAALYPLLLPYAARNASISLITSHGCVARSLGLLAATLKRFDDASRHFDAALAMNRRMGARPQIAVTLLDHARLLARKGEPECVDRSRELAEEAHAIASELGMDGLVDECNVLLDRHRAHSVEGSPAPLPDAGFHLVKDGQVWTLSRKDERVLLSDTKGLTYLAELVRHPHRDIHVLDLIALFAGAGSEPGPAVRDASEIGTANRFGLADDLLDAKARRAYQRQLTTLRAELDAAEAAGEPERTLVLHQEVDHLRRELARATGLGGRSRRTSDAERARVSVTRTLRLALTRIAEVSPELGGAMARCVRTGTFCCYAPDPAG